MASCMGCENESHYHAHSGLVSLHALEDECFAIGGLAALGADDAQALADSLCGALAAPLCPVIFVADAGGAMAMHSTTRENADAELKWRIEITAGASPVIETLIHELAHHLVCVRDLDWEAPSHGRVFKAAYREVLGAFAALKKTEKGEVKMNGGLNMGGADAVMASGREAVNAGVIVGAHPAAALFPMMGDAEYARLRDSIAARGQDVPIIVNGAGLVVDGRNRLRACNELGIAPLVERRADIGESDIGAFVVAANAARRHMTTAALTLVAARVAYADGESRTVAEVAALHGVSARNVKTAKALIFSDRADILALVEREALGVRGAGSWLNLVKAADDAGAGDADADKAQGVAMELLSQVENWGKLQRAKADLDAAKALGFSKAEKADLKRALVDARSLAYSDGAMNPNKAEKTLKAELAEIRKQREEALADAKRKREQAALEREEEARKQREAEEQALAQAEWEAEQERRRLEREEQRRLEREAREKRQEIERAERREREAREKERIRKMLEERAARENADGADDDADADESENADADADAGAGAGENADDSHNADADDGENADDADMDAVINDKFIIVSADPEFVSAVKADIAGYIAPDADDADDDSHNADDADESDADESDADESDADDADDDADDDSYLSDAEQNTALSALNWLHRQILSGDRLASRNAASELLDILGGPVEVEIVRAA